MTSFLQGCCLESQDLGRGIDTGGGAPKVGQGVSSLGFLQEVALCLKIDRAEGKVM